MTLALAPSCSPPKPPRSILDIRQIARVPQALTEVHRWLVWGWFLRDRKWTKPPFQPRCPARFASATNPAHCSDYSTALQAYIDNPSLDGVGFALGEHEGKFYSGIDLDKCIDGNGVLSAEAEKVVKLAGSYAEVSPSGRGVKIILIGDTKVVSGRRGGVEIYGHSRYFTITGRAL